MQPAAAVVETAASRALADRTGRSAAGCPVLYGTGLMAVIDPAAGFSRRRRRSNDPGGCAVADRPGPQVLERLDRYPAEGLGRAGE